MATTEYKGKYHKLFPGILSSNSFLTVYLLHLLDKHPRMYGKELADTIKDQLKGTWTPSHGLIYPLLRDMEEEGLVRSMWEGDGRKKTKCFYEITEEGRKALRIERQKIRPLIEKSKELIEIVMNDLYVKTIS